VYVLARVVFSNLGGAHPVGQRQLPFDRIGLSGARIFFDLRGLAGDKSIFFSGFFHSLAWRSYVEFHPFFYPLVNIHHRQIDGLAIRNVRHGVDCSVGCSCPSIYFGEYIMATTATVATSAVAVETIKGFDSIDSARETLFQLGTETFQAERLMAKGKEALDVLDANLFGIIKDLSYVEFMKVREFHIAGAVDLLDSVDAAQKRWERQVNRISSGFTVKNEKGESVPFTRPKSESKDAVRKAEAKAKEIAKLAEFGTAELEEKRKALRAQDTDASNREADKLRKEIKRREADSIDAEKALVKATADKIIARVKELAKAGTDDSMDLLAQVALLLG